MSFPNSHKTVIVLDRSPYFAQSSKQTIEYDVLSKSKSPGLIPAAPITKSLWTSCVESVIEFIRIVYDIFPTKKLIRVVSGVHSLNTWNQKDQGMQQVMMSLARIGPASSGGSEEEYDVMHGLSTAIEVLCEPSEIQHELRTSLSESSSNVLNRGRIICLTSVKSEGHIRTLEGCLMDALLQHNKLAAQTDTLLPINQCDLVLIHVVPVGDEIKIVDKPLKEVSSQLSVEVYVTQAGRTLYNKLAALVQHYYNLSSTTVTGIPMKEEQNASSSANYDVELLHPAVAHEELKRQVGGHAEGLIIPSKEGLPTETVTLKWCTPKSNLVELHHCTSCHRITPVDVNSRPSSCLTNFLLGGRAVMLEQPRKSGTKVISHMLASHGGEIFIHTLSICRSILEDPPSISEGSGGRVTDYRITDFGEFMKENRLAPIIPAGAPLADTTLQPIQRAKKHIERLTRYWPMVISDTLILNMRQQIEPLASLIMKEKLAEEDVLECHKVMFGFLEMESRNDPFPTSVTGSRGKGPKREEQYRQFWNELETLVRCYSDTSPMHEKVLDWIKNCKKPSEDSRTLTSPKRTADKAFSKDKTDSSEPDQGWKDFDKFQKMSDRERLEYNSSGKPDSTTTTTGSTTATATSLLSHKMKKTEDSFGRTTSETSNFLAMWTSCINSTQSKMHEEFIGRSEHQGAGPAELYPHLKEENVGESVDNTSPKNSTNKH
ncbi:integrator complex subunit 13 [Argonauta hians]